MRVDAMFPRRPYTGGEPDFPVSEIVGRLAGNAEALCRELLPNGRRDGAEWRCGSVQGEPGKSLAVHLTGAKAGIWSDFEDGSKGDPLDLIQACLNLDKGAAVLWAKDWIEVDDRSRWSSRQPTPQPQHSEAPRQDNPNQPLALEIWQASRLAVGTLVGTYLCSRGIALPVPPTIRYHPGLKHAPTGLVLPAMVAAVTRWPSRDIYGTHRTFLKLDGRDKAPVSQNKMMLGTIAGGAVRLAPIGPKLIVAEGLETSLSAQEAAGLPVWAVLSASNFMSLILPEMPLAAEVVIAADHDDAGILVAEKAAALWSSQGRKVWIAQPPKPGTDFNDLARVELSAREGFAA